jgi:mannose-6-phosphate isomerase
MAVHPLVFEPILKPKLWGGRRLAEVLGKRLPPGQMVGESWELSDLPGNESIVREGPCRGVSLHWLLNEWSAGMLGHARSMEGRFPLLIKFLDASQDLSVQVHPPREMASKVPNAYLKNEAWYIIAAERDAAIYHGLNPGATREQLVDALHTGQVTPLLRRVPVRPGDCYYLPSGTVHALGAGVLVAEVQTPSDTTYRLFDWNRTNESTGRPRELHVEQALACIEFDKPAPDLRQERSHAADYWTTVTRLVGCEQFVIEKVRMIEGAEQTIPYAEPVVWIMLDGQTEIIYDGGRGRLPVRRGDVVLLPAALQEARVRVIQPAVWLDVSIPTPSDLARYDRPDRSALPPPPRTTDSLVRINLPPDLEPGGRNRME